MKLNNKSILVVGTIILLVLIFMNKPPAKEMIKRGITDVFTRLVTHPGDGKTFPSLYCGETATVSISGILTDTDSTQNEWVNIEENVPSWTYNAGDLALSMGKLVTAEGDLPAGTKTYSYTVTAPSSASTLTFSGRYQVGEGPLGGTFQSTGGTSSLSCSVCTSQTCNSGNEYCCNTVDDNCNHDLNELNELTVSQDCDKTLGVCAGSTKSCISNVWETTCPTSKYGPNYQAIETNCDDYDNDCDGSKNEEMIHVGVNNENQNGVCINSKKSCDSSHIIWFDDYSGITDYVATETANTQYCDDKDNDCDNIIDEPKNGKSDRDCSGIVSGQEILEAINAYRGSPAIFPLGTFTFENIGDQFRAYYGAIL